MVTAPIEIYTRQKRVGENVQNYFSDYVKTGLEENRRMLALSLHNSVYIHLLQNNRRYFCNLKVNNTLEKLKKHQCLHKLL